MLFPCISITLDGSRKIYRDIVKATENSGAIQKKNDSLLTIEFITGSIIYFRSGEQKDTLRGLTIKNGGMLIVDECAYIDEDFFYSVLLPMTNVFRANILLTSTPRFKTGFFTLTMRREETETQESILLTSPISI